VARRLHSRHTSAQYVYKWVRGSLCVCTYMSWLNLFVCLYRYGKVARQLHSRHASSQNRPWLDTPPCHSALGPLDPVAVCCSVLHCVAVCCSVLQCVTVRCSALRCAALWDTTVSLGTRTPWHCCSVLQCVAVCCSVLQCGAVCCSVLQCVVVYWSVL